MGPAARHRVCTGGERIVQPKLLIQFQPNFAEQYSDYGLYTRGQLSKLKV